MRALSQIASVAALLAALAVLPATLIALSQMADVRRQLLFRFSDN